MSKWISVKDRLPYLNGRYLVTVEYTDRRVIQIVGYAKNLSEIDEYDFHDDRGDGWYLYDGEYGYYTVNNIIAWMPLPEPYKEGEAE